MVQDRMNETTINPRHRFDTYHAGSENSKAVELMKSLACSGLGHCIFLIGPSACGKTHLLSAYANTVLANNPDHKLLYLRIDDLMSQYATSLHSNCFSAFSEHLASCQLLLLDNVQFALGREDLIQTISEVYIQHGKSILMAGDYLLRNLQKLPLSVIKLVLPSYSTRYEIVQHQAAEMGLSIETSALEKIAMKSKNARQLRGAILHEHLNQNLSDISSTMNH